MTDASAATGSATPLTDSAQHAQPDPPADAAGAPGTDFAATLKQAEQPVLDAAAAGERQTLEAFLDYLRWAVARKAHGVTEEQARERRVASETTLAGLLLHLTVVEDRWFQFTVAADADPEKSAVRLPPPGKSWDLPDGATLASLTADYERACARSRETAARYALGDVFDTGDGFSVSLRWILIHMVEETARHAGHADILREQIDGRSGDGD